MQADYYQCDSVDVMSMVLKPCFNQIQELNSFHRTVVIIL